jgi:hypothetical protein
MFQSRVAVVEGHNKDSNTDNLYEPLRKTFLVDTTAKKDLMAEASMVSQISHTIRPGTYAQNYMLVTMLSCRAPKPSFPRMSHSNPLMNEYQ